MASAERAKTDREESGEPLSRVTSETRKRHGHFLRRSRTPRWYDLCDGATEGLLYVMVIFGPWAYGTTQTWSTWVMNGVAYGIGVLLVTKWSLRWRTGYEPVRWGEDGGSVGRSFGGAVIREVEQAGQRAEVGDQRTEVRGQRSAEEGRPRPSPHSCFSWLGRISARTLTRGLATLTVVVLGYCLVSALNARATYDPAHLFQFHECLDWLPHSYDSRSTWFVFWQYLGLAFVFWATRDWLLGQTRRERRSSEAASQKSEVRGRESEVSSQWSAVSGQKSDIGDQPSFASHSEKSAIYNLKSEMRPLPSRLQRLLWVICVNGAVLAMECILQRLSGTGKLLWLREPFWNKDAISQFGPFAYRGNAAEYLILVWPVCLGFWWALRRAVRHSPRIAVRTGSDPHVLLLPCAVVTAAGPIISTARAGAIIAAAAILVATALLLWHTRRGGWFSRVGVVTLFFAITSFAAYLGWTQLEQRLRTLFSDEMSGRVTIYENARKMAVEFPWLGSGPGTFSPLYQEYRGGLQQVWEAWVHNDWLETRITFGRIGFTLILLMLIIVGVRWFLGRGEGAVVAAGFSLRPPGHQAGEHVGPTVERFIERRRPPAGCIHLPRFSVQMLWLAGAGILVYARVDFPLQVYSTLFLFVVLCAILFCLSRE